jgi:O-methyltransferase
VWRNKVNAALRRATGYQLQRPQVPQVSHPDPVRLRKRLAEHRRTLEETRRELAQAQRRLERTQAAPRRAPRPRPKKMPRYVDDGAAEILRRVDGRTMTDYTKLFGLVEATRYIARREIPGAIVECGVWRGGSMQAVALTLLEQGRDDRALHLFDTFEGMPPPTEHDRRGDTTAEEMLARHDKDHQVWAIAGLEDVQEAMAEVGYPADLVRFHQGLVEDTVPGDAPEQIALLRLDTDWYESTRHELEHLYARLSPGGVLIIDDYGDWDGARLATDEFVAALEHPPLLSPLGSGRIAVKPIG